MTDRLSPALAAVRRALPIVLAVLAATVAAAPGDEGERTRLAAERSAVDSRFAARERECKERFVVTACVDEAKRERRRAIEELRLRQLRLDEARRRTRSNERRLELAAKAAEEARREQERAARSAPSRRDARPLEPRRGDAAGSVARIGKVRDPRRGGSGEVATGGRAETAAVRQDREARNRQSFETRLRQAAEHRDDVLGKTTRRMGDRAQAAPLPAVPASAPH